jgi:hypothetical protein
MSGGFVLAPDSNGFGFISIQYRLPNNLITGLQLDYIIVDRTHLKVLESEGVAFAAGDAFTQSSINVAVPNTALAGPFALTLQGPNNFALGAVLVATPTSGSTSDGTISGTGDLNASTPASNAAVTGTYTMTGSGRGTMTLSVGALSRQFVVYPSTGGVQMFETDALDLVNGIAVQQSPGPFSSASIDGYFGAVLASRNSAGAVSGIFHFTSTSASVTGEDFFISSAGTTSKGSGFFPGSSIVVNSNGRAAVSLPFSANTSNTAHFVIYLVDPTKMLFIQTDAGQAGRGIIQQQLQSQL